MGTLEDTATGGIALALSGGGFRASFFHVGVLKRLAELEKLGDVRVISCVSGGSIAGSVYYLSLIDRLLLPGKEIKPDKQPSLHLEPLEAADYTACVEKTEQVLTKIAQSNVRATVFRNPLKNLTMFLSPQYSRTDRAGDMLDRHLRESFGIDTGVRYRFWRNQIEMRRLHFVREDLPRLVLNATTLNTGHAWRFDTDGMGELLAKKRRTVDKNDLLQWTTYAELEQMGSEQQDFPYALAVAASAAFPGLFRPLPISGLYDRRVDLMDGGAQDNQGIQSLLGERPPSMAAILFDRVIVSDGAAQLADEKTKRRSFIAVQRVIGIQGDRIREEQLLAGRSWVEVSGRFDLLDLRRGLPSLDVSASGEVTPAENATQPTANEFTLDVRERLAQLRTDLDAFGPLETTLLARRGYDVATATLGEAGADPGAPLALPAIRTKEVLAAAAKQAFKPFAVYGAAKLVSGLLILAVVATAAWSLKFLAPDPTWRLPVRLLLFTLFFLAPVIISRLFLLKARAWPRQVKWAGALAIYAGLWLAAVFGGPLIDHWGDAVWSRTDAAWIAGVLLVAPAIAPTLLWLLLWLEGRWWRRLARLPAG